MEPPAKVPRLAPAALAEPAEPPPPPQLNLRCSPADTDVPCGFATLPDDVLFRFFTALPADARARCARVCAPWLEALVRGPDAWRCWTRLDLSGGSGVACTKCDTALEGAAALACGRLQELDLSHRGGKYYRDGITLDALLRVLRGSAELQVLALDGVDRQDNLGFRQLRQLLAAAPTLQRLDADNVVCFYSAERLQMLRAEPPYVPLRMRRLTSFNHFDPPGEGIGTVDGARRFGAAVSHAWLRELDIDNIKWIEPAALGALVDAVLARTCRVEALTLDRCSGMSPASYLPVLARLLAGRDGAALKSMRIAYGASLFEGASEADVELSKAALRQAATVVPQLRSNIY